MKHVGLLHFTTFGMIRAVVPTYIASFYLCHRRYRLKHFLICYYWPSPRQKHFPNLQASVQIGQMSEPKNHQSLLAKLMFSTLLLLLLAGTLRYSSNASNTNVQIVYEVAPQPGLEPAPGKVAVPFGNKDGFQAITYHNTTYSSVEISPLADATELQERAFKW